MIKNHRTKPLSHHFQSRDGRTKNTKKLHKRKSKPTPDGYNCPRCRYILYSNGGKKARPLYDFTDPTPYTTHRPRGSTHPPIEWKKSSLYSSLCAGIRAWCYAILGGGPSTLPLVDWPPSSVGIRDLGCAAKFGKVAPPIWDCRRPI